VQNDGYERLQKFIAYENNQPSKKNSITIDPMLKIDLQQFKNSTDFRAYLKQQDKTLDTFESLFVGWIYLLITEISLFLCYILRRLRRSFKK
jgi:hypothetical protein